MREEGNQFCIFPIFHSSFRVYFYPHCPIASFLQCLSTLLEWLNRAFQASSHFCANLWSGPLTLLKPGLTRLLGAASGLAYANKSWLLLIVSPGKQVNIQKTRSQAKSFPGLSVQSSLPNSIREPRERAGKKKKSCISLSCSFF